MRTASICPAPVASCRASPCGSISRPSRRSATRSASRSRDPPPSRSPMAAPRSAISPFSRMAAAFRYKAAPARRSRSIYPSKACRSRSPRWPSRASASPGHSMAKRASLAQGQRRMAIGASSSRASSPHRPNPLAYRRSTQRYPVDSALDAQPSAAISRPARRARSGSQVRSRLIQTGRSISPSWANSMPASPTRLSRSADSG